MNLQRKRLLGDWPLIQTTDFEFKIKFINDSVLVPFERSPHMVYGSRAKRYLAMFHRDDLNFEQALYISSLYLVRESVYRLEYKKRKFYLTIDNDSGLAEIKPAKKYKSI